MSVLEKLNFWITNNKLTLEFINFIYEINKKPWRKGGECHLETWCDGACKMINPIIDCYKKDIPIEQKKKMLFIIHCLNKKKALLRNYLHFLFL